MTTPEKRPRWWRTLTASGFCAVIVVVIVGCAVAASHTGMTICGRTNPCENGGDTAGMVGLAVAIIVVIVVVSAAYAVVVGRLERRVFGARDAARRGRRSGDPRRRDRSRSRR